MLRTNPDVVTRRMDEEVVLVHLRTNRIYTLNATAARFWELAESGVPRAAIKRVLLDEFDVDELALETEIDALVAELSGQELLMSDASL
jgi:Coenzyme PQQ synthesis protein D (PqqD)